jgi:hypothetical protein
MAGHVRDEISVAHLLCLRNDLDEVTLPLMNRVDVPIPVCLVVVPHQDLKLTVIGFIGLVEQVPHCIAHYCGNIASGMEHIAKNKPYSNTLGIACLEAIPKGVKDVFQAAVDVNAIV